MKGARFMSIDLVIGLYQGVKGEGTLRMLNRLAAGIDEGVIVAIGSYRGQTDCALALHAHVPVYAIDDRIGSVGEDIPFGDADRPVWMQNVLSLGLAERIRPINLSSFVVAQTWDQPVGLLSVDGSHDESSVTLDLHNWLPYVMPNGLVALHAADAPGVMAAIAKYADYFDLIEFADTTEVYRVVKAVEPMPEKIAQAIIGPGHIVHQDEERSL